ncbi:transglutaminase family protein [Pseudonocardia sp. GCM10023141]|uniref:transglutaminase family protein n=1 Tax=Pseudonocardia sp. GCM10023141 TaxID=3252653 RepID=UPI003611696B
MAYRVTHTTEYRYASTVSSSFGEIVMLPRELPRQHCVSSALTIQPQPHDLRERLDFFGNRTVYFAVLDPHTRLAVTATSLVRVTPEASDRPAGPPWEQAREHLSGEPGDSDAADAFDARQFALDSPQAAASPALAAYAAPSFTPGRPVLDAAAELSSRIHGDFAYLPGVTRVTTTIDEVLERRAGVCQDFAHVAIGCLRSVGLAARYVSGYLETTPPPGRERLVGADESHAWLSVFVPGTGWVDLDPTNNKVVDGRYVTTAWGRDYTDVPPLKGVIFTEGAKHDLKVSVDVEAVDG